MGSPLSSNRADVQHVFITVAGGVAYVAEAPIGVEVHIVDYDDLRADFDGTFHRLSAEEQAFWQRADALASPPGMGQG